LWFWRFKEPIELSPNEIKAIGKMWEPSLFTQDEIEELVLKVSPEVRLRGLKPSDVMNCFKSEQLEEIEAYLKQRKQQS